MCLGYYKRNGGIIMVDFTGTPLADVYFGYELYIWLSIVILWVIVVIMVKYFQSVIKKIDMLSDHIDIKPRELKMLDRILDSLFILIGIMLTLYILGVGGMLYTLLTTIGVIGIIIGFAVKDIAANLISGLIVLTERPFAPGDYIEIGSLSGTVKEISLRSTVLTMSNGVIATIPNSKFATDVIKNYTLAAERRLDLDIRILNENDLDSAFAGMKEVAEADPRVLKEKEILVVISNVEDYAITLTLRFWVKKEDLLSVKSDILKNVTERFRRDEVELAVPLRRNV